MSVSTSSGTWCGGGVGGGGGGVRVHMLRDVRSYKNMTKANRVNYFTNNANFDILNASKY